MAVRRRRRDASVGGPSMWLRAFCRACGLAESPQASHPSGDPESSLVYEVDPDFLEHQRREDPEQLDLPFER